MGQKITGDLEVTGTIKLGADTLTVSGAELNHVDGVTSAIQTQLDSKAVLANWGNPEGGYKFDGTNDYVTVPDNANLDLGTANFSISAFVLLSDYTPSAEKILLEKHASNLGYKLLLTTDAKLKLQFGNGSDFTTYSYTTDALTLTDGKAYHFSVSATRSRNAVFYVNGVLSKTVDISGSVAQTLDNTGALNIMGNGSAYHAGNVYLIRVFNRAITQAEVTKLYNNGRPDLASLDVSDTKANQTDLLTTWVNSSDPTYAYDTFTTSGKDISSAISDGSQIAIGIMQNPISLISGQKYRLTYNLTLNSGTAPKVAFQGNTEGTGAPQSAQTLLVAGANSVEITATATGTSYMALLNRIGEATDFAITCTPLVLTGCVAEYLPQNAGRTGWIETQNNLHGSTSGSPISLGAEQGIEKYKDIKLTVTDDTTITNAVPKGYMLKSITVNNSTANAFTMNVGTTAGATDVVNGASIAVSGLTTITINKAFSTTANQTLYVTDTGGWNSSSNNIHLIMEKL